MRKLFLIIILVLIFSGARCNRHPQLQPIPPAPPAATQPTTNADEDEEDEQVVVVGPVGRAPQPPPAPPAQPPVQPPTPPTPPAPPPTNVPLVQIERGPTETNAPAPPPSRTRVEQPLPPLVPLTPTNRPAPTNQPASQPPAAPVNTTPPQPTPTPEPVPLVSTAKYTIDGKWGESVVALDNTHNESIEIYGHLKEYIRAPDHRTFTFKDGTVKWSFQSWSNSQCGEVKQAGNGAFSLKGRYPMDGEIVLQTDGTYYGSLSKDVPVNVQRISWTCEGMPDDSMYQTAHIELNFDGKTSNKNRIIFSQTKAVEPSSESGFASGSIQRVWDLLLPPE